MKKLYSMALLLVSLFSLESAFAISVTSHSSIQTSCNGGTFPPLAIYGNQTWHLWDRLNSSGEGIISSNSEVSVFVDSNKLNVPNGWVQVSNYVPGPGAFYTMWNNNLTTLNLANLVPSDRDRAIGQVVFKIRRMYTGSNNTYAFSGAYTYSPFTGSVPVQTNLGNLNKKFDVSTLTADEECMTIVPRWCGDGVVDAAQGEQCDAGAQNGQPGSLCSATCTNIIVPPVCVAGSVTGPQSAAINASTPGLCQTGPVGDFTQNVNGNTTSYSWSCNGVSGGNCNATYTIPGNIVPSCNNLTINAGSTALNAVVAGTVLNFTGVGSNLGANPIYRLVITNTTANTSVTLTGSTGIFTYTIPVTASYTATLFIDNTPRGTVGGSGACAVNFAGGTIPGGSDDYFACNTSVSCQSYATRAHCESIYGPGRCYAAEAACVSAAPVQCGGSPGVPCGNGTLQTGEQCDLGPLNGQPGSGCSAICTLSFIGRSICGDGIVQRPNSDLQFEQCDSPEPWCQQCSITITNPGENGAGNIRMIRTNPGTSTLPLSLSSYMVIVGDKVPLFGQYDKIVFRNGSSSGVYLGDQTYAISNKADFISGTGILRSFPVNSGVGIVDYLDYYETDGSGNFLIDASGSKIPHYARAHYGPTYTLFEWSDLKNFKGDTSGFSSSQVYDDTVFTGVIFPSQGTKNLYVNVGYIEDALPVRVTKNMVSSINGGNAAIFNPVGFSVDYTVNGFINNLSNGNFVATSSNSTGLNAKNNLSSLTNRVSDNDINARLQEKNSEDTNNIEKIRFNSSVPSYEAQIISAADFDLKTVKMGDNNKVRVLKNGNMKITSAGTQLKLKGVRTIVIENGDLEIDKDMEYDGSDSSWAFIVKNGNIKISKNVGHIAGVFLAMNINNESGKGLLYSSDGKTPKQLIVDGSLYGDSNSLSVDRTYVRGTEDSSSLATGIIIKYSSRSLKNPPPMLTYFVEQYNQTKVAK